MLSDGLALTIWDLSSSPQSYTWCKTTKESSGKTGVSWDELQNLNAFKVLLFLENEQSWEFR